MKTGRLTKRETELINLCTSIVAGCQPCTKYHVKKCKETGISEKNINEVIKKTEHICHNATEIMLSKAREWVNIMDKKTLNPVVECDSRMDILIGIAVSYTVNNTALFEFFLNYAGNTGISNKEISDIIESAKFIYGKAKAHVDIISEQYGMIKQSNEGKDCKPGCNC